jgi:hypothetical protein
MDILHSGKNRMTEAANAGHQKKHCKPRRVFSFP